jgi:hypothetical protein
MSRPFVPKEGDEGLFSFELTPTYLFRLYAPGSSGTTSTENVSAPACPDPGEPHSEDCPCCENLLDLPPDKAAPILRAHLRWKCASTGTCNLMSWSSSLLFVLQHGLHRHKTDHEPAPLSKVFLIMLDTRKLPKQTFLRDLDAINYYYGYNFDLDRLSRIRLSPGDYYFGEYLTQGSLDIEGHCCQVSMQQLIDTGLFKLCTFSDWDLLAEPVRDIRRDSFSTEETDIEQIRLAISMGLVNMEARFAFPFAAMLLSLHARNTKDESVWNAFHAMFTAEELNDVDIIFDADVYKRKIRMKEVDQFRRLVEAIREKRPKDSVEQISEALQTLSVANTAESPVRTRRRIVYPHH